MNYEKNIREIKNYMCVIKGYTMLIDSKEKYDKYIPYIMDAFKKIDKLIKKTNFHIKTRL